MLKNENMSYVLDKDIRKVFVQSYKEVPNPIANLYNVMSSDVATESVAGMGDYGSIDEFTDKVNYKDIDQQYQTNVSHTEYAGGIQIRRKLIDDAQTSIISKLPAQLGRAMAYRRQQDAAKIFNEAFTAGSTFGDSVSLCNASHPSTSSSSVQSNTGTSLLSPANITATRLAMRKYVSPNQNIVSIIPNLLLVPIDKEDICTEILKTDKDVYGANNTINVNYGRFTYIAWEFLSSTTAWFMIDKAMMKDSLTWYNRIQTEFNKDMDTDTLVHKYSAYMRYSATTSDFRWIMGQNATA